jgi:hypothetical protein
MSLASQQIMENKNTGSRATEAADQDAQTKIAEAAKKTDRVRATGRNSRQIGREMVTKVTHATPARQQRK